MSALVRWTIRLGTSAGITLLLWVVALLSSMVPAVARLDTNVHGLSLADYRQEPSRRLAPLSAQIIRDVQQDRSGTSPSASPTATPLPTSSPVPTPSTLPTPAPTPNPTPLPTLPPLPTPSIPPLPTPTPTIPPLPTPTPSIPPLPTSTPTLPPPPPIP